MSFSIDASFKEFSHSTSDGSWSEIDAGTAPTHPVRKVRMTRRPEPQIVTIKGVEYEVTVTSENGQELRASKDLMKIVKNMGTAFASKNRGFTEADFDIVEKSSHDGLPLDALTVDRSRPHARSRLPVSAKSYKFENIVIDNAPVEKTPEQKKIIKIFEKNFDAPTRTHTRGSTHTIEDEDDASTEASSVSNRESNSRTAESEESLSVSEEVAHKSKKKTSKRRKNEESDNSATASEEPKPARRKPRQDIFAAKSNSDSDSVETDSTETSAEDDASYRAATSGSEEDSSIEYL